MLNPLFRVAASLTLAGFLASGAAPARAAEKYEICAGAFGSVTYQLSFAVAEVLKQIAPRYSLVPVETSGAAASVVKGAARPGTTLMAFGALTFRQALRGMAPFQQAYPDLKVLGFATQNVQTLITYDPDVKTLADLKGKRVGMSVRPSVCGLDHWEIVRRGIPDGETMVPSYMNWSGLQSALMDGTIDAAALGVSTHPTGPWAPLSMYAELAASKGAPRFLDIDEAWIRAASEARGLPYRPVLMPRGAIADNVPDHDVTTWEERIGILAYASVPDDLAYTVTKILCEHQADLAALSPVGRAMSLAVTVPSSEFLADDQIHPGALRYYRQKGLRD